MRAIQKIADRIRAGSKFRELAATVKVKFKPQTAISVIKRFPRVLFSAEDRNNKRLSFQRHRSARRTLSRVSMCWSRGSIFCLLHVGDAAERKRLKRSMQTVV